MNTTTGFTTPPPASEVFHEVLDRYQFPTFPEVLDEMELIARDF